MYNEFFVIYIGSFDTPSISFLLAYFLPRRYLHVLTTQECPQNQKRNTLSVFREF